MVFKFKENIMLNYIEKRSVLPILIMSYATPFQSQTAGASFYTAVLSGMANVDYINPRSSQQINVTLPGFAQFGTQPSAAIQKVANSQVSLLTCSQSGQSGKPCVSDKQCVQKSAPACPGISCKNHKCQM